MNHTTVPLTKVKAIWPSWPISLICMNLLHKSVSTEDTSVTFSLSQVRRPLACMFSDVSLEQTHNLSFMPRLSSQTILVNLEKEIRLKMPWKISCEKLKLFSIIRIIFICNNIYRDITHIQNISQKVCLHIMGKDIYLFTYITSWLTLET